MIRPRAPKEKAFYAHEELPQPSRANFYVRLNEVVEDWQALAKPLYPAFDLLYGRPTDPAVYLRIFLVGYFENIVYDTDLAERIADSVAIRHFVGFGLCEKTPDHSTISLVRARVAAVCCLEDVLKLVVARCIAEGLVGGELAAGDASLVPANASLSGLRSVVTGQRVGEYLREVAARNREAEKHAGEAPQAPEGAEAAPERQGAPHEEGGRGSRVKAGKPKGKERPKVTNEEFRSGTDPDARIMAPEGKPRDMYYRATHLTDAQSQIILAARADYADGDEREAARSALSEAKATLEESSMKLDTVVFDAGYDAASFHAHVESLGIRPVTNYKQDSHDKPAAFKKAAFRYDAEANCYYCPGGHRLSYHGKNGGRFEYVARKEDCGGCPHRDSCLGEGARARWISRGEQEESRDRVIAYCHTDDGRSALRARKHIVEPPFGHMKTYGGLSLINSRGLKKAHVKVVMAAVAWNLIRLLNCLVGRGRRHRTAAALAGAPPNWVEVGLRAFLASAQRCLGRMIGALPSLALRPVFC